YAIAPDIGYKARPELRFFVSYLHARDFNPELNKGIQSYDDTSKYYKRDYCIGVQAEAWW
ncbi:MAG: carbohydrate porin, partial [Succinivibrio dextrinosolvens]|nr:carbohydrate porin [Succinivibrio dextrinosolvens]